MRLAERLRSGTPPRPGDGYYASRPLREPVEGELLDADGTPRALITRNSYGCLVLNTARALFVDIDLPEPPRKSAGFFAVLFGKKTEQPPDDTALQAALAKAADWARANAPWQWRAYRTRAGLRLLATHALFEPDAPGTDALFIALDADPLYRRLCKAQKCFRARLTPKPWRCGHHAATDRWPFADARSEQRFEKWKAAYIGASRDYATCELVATIGEAPTHQALSELVTLHDQAARVGSGLELA
jgi:hypothetical protein